MKDIGLVGVPFSGKSTLFTALTRAGAKGGTASQAVATVPDPRVETLATMERSKKIVHAQVRFTDVPGGTSSAHGIAQLREMDALAIVVRAFGGDAKPAADLAEVTADLTLADMAVVDSAVKKAEKRARARDALHGEQLLRDAGLTKDEEKELRAIAPLTLKPWVVVANLEEGTEVPPELPE